MGAGHHRRRAPGSEAAAGHARHAHDRFASTRLRALFADADLGPELRAISIGPHHVRLRLAPGASPRIVEHAVHAVGDTMRIIHAAPESEPRHSCTTTIPYPS